jgi:protein-disulfide isomerase
MTIALSRRQTISFLGVSLSALALAACSDSGSETQTGGEPAPAASAPEPQGSVDMAELLKPGPLPEKILGKADAPEYASMTCPHCANFHANTLPSIKKSYIDTGKARLILREFNFDPRAEAGSMLARCADYRYFAMVDVLYQQQKTWASAENARDALFQIAKLAGFSQASFEQCLTDQKLLDDIRAVKDRGANDFGVDSTPTFFINGNVYKGALTVEQVTAILETFLSA